MKISKSQTFIFLIYTVLTLSSCRNDEGIVGKTRVNGLENTEMLISQDHVMDSKKIHYAIINNTDTIDSGYLFWMYDDLDEESLYVNSYDSIVYVTFSNDMNNVLYFVDLKTKLYENYSFGDKWTEVGKEKYSLISDSLHNFKDSIFKVLYNNNKNLKMTGYNKENDN